MYANLHYHVRLQSACLILNIKCLSVLHRLELIKSTELWAKKRARFEACFDLLGQWKLIEIVVSAWHFSLSLISFWRQLICLLVIIIKRHRLHSFIMEWCICFIKSCLKKGIQQSTGMRLGGDFEYHCEINYRKA